MVTLLDRLAGIPRIDPCVEFTLSQYFDVEGTTIDWRNHRLSPLARQLGASLFSPGRQFMVDRLYLGVLFYGTVLRRLPANSDVQAALFHRVRTVGEALTSHDLDRDMLPHPRVETLGPTSTPTLHAVRVVLHAGRDGRPAIRDYPLRNAVGWWVAPLCVLGSLADAGDEREQELLGYWLRGMAEFYQRRGGPNSAATPAVAAESGLVSAVDHVIARICVDRTRARDDASDVDERSAARRFRLPRVGSRTGRRDGRVRGRRPVRLESPDTGR